MTHTVWQRRHPVLHIFAVLALAFFLSIVGILTVRHKKQLKKGLDSHRIWLNHYINFFPYSSSNTNSDCSYIICISDLFTRFITYINDCFKKRAWNQIQTLVTSYGFIYYLENSHYHISINCQCKNLSIFYTSTYFMSLFDWL